MCFFIFITALLENVLIGPLQDPVTWYRINYAGTQITQWNFQNKGTLTSPARHFRVLKVPLSYLCPSIIYSTPCDRLMAKSSRLVNSLACHSFPVSDIIMKCFVFFFFSLNLMRIVSHFLQLPGLFWNWPFERPGHMMQNHTCW